MTGPNTQTFKHTDARLQYKGDWQGIHNATPGALATSNDPNATVLFISPSKAIAFRYYGMKTQLVRICIDCTLQNPHFETQNALNQTGDSHETPPSALLFAQPFPPPGINTIVIQGVLNSGPPNNPSITLDHFEIDVPTSVPGPQPHKAPIGAIVGGTVGGVVGILIICAIGFYLLWRRKTRRRISEHVGESGFDPSPTPYELPKPTPLTQMRSTASLTEGKSGGPNNSSHLQAHHLPPSSGLPSNSLSEMPQPEREVDAGPMDDDTSAPDQLLPPDYEHVFQNSSGSGSTEATGSTQRRKR